MTARDKMVDRVRKLFAKADSAEKIGSTEEAAAFAAKAQQLAMEHTIAVHELEEAGDQDEPVEIEDLCVNWLKRAGNVNSAATWLDVLVHALCRAHFCFPIVFKGTKIYRVAGRREDVDVVTYLMRVLSTEANRLAEAHAKSRVGVRGTERAFRAGFATAIAHRLERERHAFVADKTTALQVFDERTRKAEIAIRAEHEVRDAKPKKQSPLDAAAFEAGYVEGESVSLRRAVAGRVAAPRQIGGGS